MTDLANKIFKGRFHSLRVAMLYALIVGLLFASVTFATIKYASNKIIQNVYMSEDRRIEREKEYALDLQNYVKENKMTSEDIEGLADWTQRNKYLYVMIYKDDQLFFESGRFDEDKKDEENKKPGDEAVKPDGTKPEKPEKPDGEATPDGTKPNKPEENKDKEEDKYPRPGFTIDGPTREDLIKYAQENDSHPIVMDDTVVFASMADFTEYLYYDLSNITAICAAMIVLIIIIMLYFHGMTSRISKLGKDVTAVAEGDMNHVIHANGSDEIAKLSLDVEHMRSSILDNVEKERAALDANSQLITSMSHDIRTPLTILLGYLDMMKLHSEDGVMKDYINASEKTALRLKKLSDDLFNYFLVFGGGLNDIELSEYDAGTLVEQLLFEHVLLLREQGCEVNMVFDKDSEDKIAGLKVLTEAPQLMRIVENVFSNIHKYADKSYPVSINVGLDQGKLFLEFSNKIAKDSHDVESNGIGLKTCAKIAEAIKADFSIENDGEFYNVTILLNTVNNEKNNVKQLPPKKVSAKKKKSAKNNEKQG